MTVNLTPRLAALVCQKVETGLYNNASEVVREALRLMEEGDRFRGLQSAIASGDAQCARGEATTRRGRQTRGADESRPERHMG